MQNQQLLIVPSSNNKQQLMHHQHSRHQSNQHIVHQSTNKLETASAATVSDRNSSKNFAAAGVVVIDHHSRQNSRSSIKKKAPESLKILSGHRSPGSLPHHKAMAGPSSSKQKNSLTIEKSHTAAGVSTPNSLSTGLQQKARKQNDKTARNKLTSSVNQAGSKKESTFLQLQSRRTPDFDKKTMRIDPALKQVFHQDQLLRPMTSDKKS